MCRSTRYLRMLPCVLAMAWLLSDGGKAKGQHLLFDFGYHASFTFMDASGLEQTQMTAAYDGIDYWSSSGGSPGGLRLAQYDGQTGMLISTYAPGLDFRSIFTDDSGNLYARQYADATIYKQSAPGSFVSALRLSGGALDPQSAVVVNSDQTEYIAMNVGIVSRWDLSGAFLGFTTLAGYGTRFGESDYPNNRGIASAGGYWLTYSNYVLSAWDEQGNRVDHTKLIGAGISFDSHFSLSYANSMVFIVDEPGGLWRGYDVGLGP